MWYLIVLIPDLCTLTSFLDETPFKEPYVRIPPALYEEVGGHLMKMLDAGAIRESGSPFSSNVVLVPQERWFP